MLELKEMEKENEKEQERDAKDIKQRLKDINE